MFDEDTTEFEQPKSAVCKVKFLKHHVAGNPEYERYNGQPSFLEFAPSDTPVDMLREKAERLAAKGVVEIV